MGACIPTSISLIGDYFPHEQRGKANSIFGFGVYLGVALSSLTLLINQAVGWRNALLIVCTICLAFALLALILREPARNQSTDLIVINMSDQPSVELTFGDKMKTIFTNKCYLYLLGAAFFRYLGGYSMGFWNATFFEGVYPSHTDAFSVGNAMVTVFGGMPSALLGGYIADRYEP